MFPHSSVDSSVANNLISELNDEDCAHRSDTSCNIGDGSPTTSFETDEVAAAMSLSALCSEFFKPK
jgi:hypothetical protein